MGDKKKYKALITSAGVGDPQVLVTLEFIGSTDHGGSQPSDSDPAANDYNGTIPASCS
jgi:hypothetical protein